jgi:2-keto-4-pentenoate hydratase/2-oxohepta-3-ene-1,7-dioic acid hydratase in catechol pathway
MRLVSFAGRIGSLVDNDTAVIDITDVVGHCAEPMKRLIADWGKVRGDVQRKAADPRSARIPVSTIRLEAPVPRPGIIVAAPVNYRDHQVEMQQSGDVSHLGFFLKAPASVLRPGGTVRLPYDDRRFDQEGELAAVIGRTASKVSPEQALDHVFGYTGLLDITMRGGEDRSIRKSFDTFTPMGPWIVTADEIADPGNLDLKCSVSGQLRQKANTRDLIWGVAEFVAYASSVFTLEAGDIVTTGTPAGVGPLEDSDQIVLDIEHIGSLAVGVSAEGAVTCPTLGKDRGPIPPPPRPRP